MLFPSGQFRVFLYPRDLDMRAGYDRLAYLCEYELGMNPYGGAIFLFFNRQRNRAKIYFYDGTGSCMFAKRLEKGRFQVPQVREGDTHGVVASSELALLLEGADLRSLRRGREWRPKDSEK